MLQSFWSNAETPARFLLTLSFLLVLMPAVGQAAPAMVGTLCEADVQEHWLMLDDPQPSLPIHFLVLQHSSGALLVRQLDLLQLDIPAPDAAAYWYRGELFYLAEKMPGWAVSIRWREQKITLRQTRNSLATTLELDQSLTRCRPKTLINAALEKEEFDELLLEVLVNGQPQRGVVVALQLAEGSLLLPVIALQDWRLDVPDQPRFEHFGEFYFPLQGFAEATYDIDLGRMVLDLEFLPHHFTGTRHQAGRRAGLLTTESANGLFFNYDLHMERLHWAQRNKVDDAQREDKVNGAQRDKVERYGGFYELGLFAERGVLTHTTLHRKGANRKEWVRLETQWRQDNPERMTTTRWGDAVTEPGAWGNAVRYGGISWGTNFETRPDLVTFPQPQIAGETPTPASVDVYVNNIRRLQTQVPAGPFTIDEVPIMTGAGNLQLVTRDSLGRETVINQPFYGSTRLLRRGLYSYHYTAGALRENYTHADGDYGAAFVSSTHRYGFTDGFTGELRAELGEQVQTYGASVSLSHDSLGAMHWSEAHSLDEHNIRGRMSEVRLERSGRYLSLGLRKRNTSSTFRQLTHSPSDQSELLQVFSSVRIPNHGSLALSYIDRQTHRDHSRIVSVGYNRRIAKKASFTLSASKLLGEGAQYNASLVIPFGRGSSISASGHARGDRQHGRLSVQHNPPARGGLGYRAERYFGDRAGEALHGRWQTSVGAYRASATQRDHYRSYQLGARGGLAYLGRQWFAADWINGSFAAVDASGLEALPLYKENLYVTDTNADGWALVTGLRPFESNRVRLDARDIPLDTHFRTRPEQQLVPGYRRGVLLSFAIDQERSATLTLLDDQGEPVPAGAKVRHGDGGESFPVGWEGRVYLESLGGTSEFVVRWDNHQCHFAVDYPQTDDPLPHLGDYVCKP